MEGNYWDIDTLLADEESIPNIFLTTGANLAFLDPLAMKGYGDRVSFYVFCERFI